jgi:hypothetical protein
MDTFDTIEVRRPALAGIYLSLLRAQPGRPIALFAPRRVGKTFFLDHDLSPMAKRAGMLPVYAEVWLQCAAPLDAINHALEAALNDVTVPPRKSGQARQDTGQENRRRRRQPGIVGRTETPCAAGCTRIAAGHPDRTAGHRIRQNGAVDAGRNSNAGGSGPWRSDCRGVTRRAAQK